MAFHHVTPPSSILRKIASRLIVLGRFLTDYPVIIIHYAVATPSIWETFNDEGLKGNDTLLSRNAVFVGSIPGGKSNPMYSFITESN